MPTKKLKPTLTIAGAGAGKTTDMVEQIMSALPELRSNRILATITYTNSAAQTIRRKLHKKTGITPNIFIGTNHKFFNHFIVSPYATLFTEISLEKVFLELDIEKLVSKNTGTKASLSDKAVVRKNLITSLIRKGNIPLSQISKIALRVMENKNARKAICNRFQFLFIDEFQDVDTTQYKIFEYIRKEQKTKIYAVGDPEQYIMGFTYKGVRKPAFNSIPINKLLAQKKLKTENYRSCQQIVSFTNNFRNEVQQKSLATGLSVSSEVIFLPFTKLDGIVESFQTLSKDKGLSDYALHFYLSKENKTFISVAPKYNLSQLKDYANSKTVFEEALDFICGAIELSPKQISEKNGLTPLEVRLLGTSLLRIIQNNKDITQNDFLKFIESSLGFKNFTGNDFVRQNFDKTMNHISLSLQHSSQKFSNHQYSSIHKAKGLEADAVLVIAKNKAELKAWLTTDKEARKNDKNDTCRTGYVAFTRAKSLLCIACLNSLDIQLEESLKYLGVITHNSSYPHTYQEKLL